MDHPCRELIVVSRPGAGVARLRAALRDADAALAPLVPGAVGALACFHRVTAPDAALDALAARLRALPLVRGAYVKPATEAPVAPFASPAPGAASAKTPDFTARQGYLDAAPVGIDARYAWTLPGGRGEGVRVVDIEGGWNFDHEDLRENKGGVIGGRPYPGIDWRNHGTAVLGEVGGDVNDLGVTGIAPGAHASAVSHGGQGSAAAIVQAADALGPGDILLIEAHRPGPRFEFLPRPDQRGYIPVEWWPDDLAAIQYAVERGVIVVEAAGNGAEDLDDPLYDVPAPGFPGDWVNPLRRAVDSGAVLVGAGAPPPGTHGRQHGPDRAKLDFSNYGGSVDAQGWGREVTTTGYGDLQGGAENQLYTDGFSGTSSASPIVVGALACVQGVRRARGLAPLAPVAARGALRECGSPQQDSPKFPAERFRIGTRPDLRALLALAAPSRRRVTPVALDDAPDFAWAWGDHDGDGVPDLYALRFRGTASGRLEVFVLNGADDYASVVLHARTSLSEAAAAGFAWAVGDAGGGGIPDLYGLRAAPGGGVELCVLRGADGYQTALRRALPVRAPTMPPPADAPGRYALVCDATESGHVEVHGDDPDDPATR